MLWSSCSTGFQLLGNLRGCIICYTVVVHNIISQRFSSSSLCWQACTVLQGCVYERMTTYAKIWSDENCIGNIAQSFTVKINYHLKYIYMLLVLFVILDMIVNGTFDDSVLCINHNRRLVPEMHDHLHWDPGNWIIMREHLTCVIGDWL